jgi:hypothetical protein
MCRHVLDAAALLLLLAHGLQPPAVASLALPHVGLLGRGGLDLSRRREHTHKHLRRRRSQDRIDNEEPPICRQLPLLQVAAQNGKHAACKTYIKVCPQYMTMVKHRRQAGYQR